MDWIVFDAGGVLVELDSTWPAQLGLAPQDVAAWLGGSDVFHALERGETSEARFVHAFVSAFDLPDDAPVQQAFTNWVVGAYPGATQLLDTLDHRCAFLSNTNRWHWAAFDPDRSLRSRMDAQLASHLLGARKPEPGCFAKATAILGSTDVLFLDDRHDNVAAARAFGWRAEVVLGPIEAQDAILRHGGTLRDLPG